MFVRSFAMDTKPTGSFSIKVVSVQTPRDSVEVRSFVLQPITVTFIQSSSRLHFVSARKNLVHFGLYFICGIVTGYETAPNDCVQNVCNLRILTEFNKGQIREHLIRHRGRLAGSASNIITYSRVSFFQENSIYVIQKYTS